MDSLKAHLAHAHGVQFEHIQKSFPSSQLFEEWKASVENEQFFNKIARSSEQVNGKGDKFRSLMCNRSGQYRPNKGHGATQRPHPQKGCTCKIGRPCTCSVKVHLYPLGEVHVDGCLMHLWPLHGGRTFQGSGNGMRQTGRKAEYWRSSVTGDS